MLSQPRFQFHSAPARLAAGLVLASCIAFQAQAQDPNGALESTVRLCADRVLDSGGFVADPNQVWDLDLVGPTGGALVYIGTTHPSSASSPEYDAIIRAYRQFRPTAVFFEGCCLVRAESEDSARAIHETALVQHLATRDGIRPVSLEPSEISLRLALLEDFPTLDVQLFYLLRDIAQERERRDAHGAVLRRRAEWYLTEQLNMSDALPTWPLRTLDDVDRALQARWPGYSWGSIPLDWFTPYVNADSVGPPLFHEINRLENKHRNATMYARLAAATLRGERVFAAVGRSHVALQADALRCALAD